MAKTKNLGRELDKIRRNTTRRQHEIETREAKRELENYKAQK